jgi:hypothetical protein
MKTFLKGLTALFFVIISAALAQAETAFYFTSTPQSWVGHGETAVVSPSDGWTFAVGPNYSAPLANGLSIYMNKRTNGYEWWTLDFRAPNGGAIEIGKTYQATRFPFETFYSPGLGGLDFSGNGRGNNTLTGWFKFSDMQISGTTLTSVAVDFYQADEGFSTWSNYGSFRYNSSIAPMASALAVGSVPEPSTYALLFGVGALGLAAFKRRKSVS